MLAGKGHPVADIGHCAGVHALLGKDERWPIASALMHFENDAGKPGNAAEAEDSLDDAHRIPRDSIGSFRCANRGVRSLSCASPSR
jgi:hypothetical protein